MTEGVDYAWGRPGPAALRGEAKFFAGRYLGHDDTGKCLTKSEAQTLSDGGLQIVVVFEDGAERSLSGHAAGVADATAAKGQAKACGMPDDRPIFFAVDFDAALSQMPEICAYLDGAADVIGRDRVGIYGGYVPVAYALDHGHATWAWQTYAWSGGVWDRRAQIQQYSNGHTIGGVSLDYDRSTKTDYGQWQVGKSPAAPAPVPAPEEDTDMMGQLTTGLHAVTPISWPRGRCKAIGFFADTGLTASGPVQLRVAFQHGPGKFTVRQVSVDSSKGKMVISFGDDAPEVDAVSVERLDGQATACAWDAS